MSDTPEQIIKEQYLALAKLLRAYRDSAIDKRLLQLTLSYCQNLHRLAQQHPDLVFAQPHLYKSQLPLLVNLAFNACIYTCLLAVRNKFDPAISIQLMCASVSLYGCDQILVEKYYQNAADTNPVVFGQNMAKMSQLLKHHQQHIWLSAFSLSSSIHSNKAKNISRLKPTVAVAYFANRLNILCTPNKSMRPLNFAHGLKALALSAPAKFYSLLTPLLEYPGLIPPGAYVQDKQSTINLVLAVHPNGLITKKVSKKQQTLLVQEPIEILLMSQEQLTKSYACQTLKGFSRLNQWWDDELTSWVASESSRQCIEVFTSTLPINSAPPSLLVIQDQLKQTNADIAVMVKAIEKEPSYAQQLQVTASLSNRQKQTVTNIQHGLAMLGYERTASVFLQHSLLSRLNQQYFPLQHAFLAFSQLLVFIVEELATETKLSSVDTAKTTAYFLLSRMFTLPSLRTQLAWKTNPQSFYQVDSLFKSPKSAALKQDATRLARAWQQDTTIIQLLQKYDCIHLEPQTKNSVKLSSFLLGAALIMANEIYFSQTNQCPQTQAYLDKALIALQFSSAQWTELQKNITIKSQIACQLL